MMFNPFDSSTEQMFGKRVSQATHQYNKYKAVWEMVIY